MDIGVHGGLVSGLVDGLFIFGPNGMQDTLTHADTLTHSLHARANTTHTHTHTHTHKHTHTHTNFQVAVLTESEKVSVWQ